MARAVLAALAIAGASALAQTQSATAPLIITATVVSTCRVEIPRAAEASTLATMPIAITCAHHAITPRVQRPIAPAPHTEVRDALLIIDF